jgi:hypothetical protein
MTQTEFGAACRSEIKTFYRVHLSQPLLEILIFLGIVYISDLNVFRRVRSRVKHMTDSSHVDRFATTYRVQITVSNSENRMQIDGRIAEIQAKDGAVHCVYV